MKKSTKYIVLAVLILAFIAIVYYYRKDLFGASASTSGGIPVPSEFPLKQGSTGSKVTALQNALNARGENLVVDGSFGPLTLGALQRQFNVSEVSETLYNQIVNG